MINRGAALLVGVALAGCVGIKVRTEEAPGFAAAQGAWRSYRWEQGPLGAASGSADELAVIDRSVRQQVERTLAGLGYRLVEGEAEFEVDYRIGGEALVGLRGYSLSPRDIAERVFAGPNAEYEVSSRFYTHRSLGYHEIAFLRLTFYDVSSRRIVWSAIARQLVDDPQAGPEQVSVDIARSVQKMLRRLPPVAS